MTKPAERPRLDVEQFRRQAHEIVDWMADYLRDLSSRPVQPTAEPGTVRAALPAAPPDSGEPFERIMADFERIIVPGLTHWGHPGFLAYFPANTSPPSILAEMLTATIGAQCMSWNTSPAATELEQVTMEWLRQMVGLSPDFTGVIQDTASTATLVAMITARDRALRDGAKAQRRNGATVDLLTAYTTLEANHSVPKGMRLAGIRPGHIRMVETGPENAMLPEALRLQIRADRAAGLVPAAVVATVGTTGSTAIDPVPAIAAICREEAVWLHVDAAWAGSAAIVPELRWIFDGVDAADSVVFNPHKWLLVNFDCSAYFVKDRAALLGSFGASAEILKTAHDDRVVNYRDWGIQLGRRFRALKLWFVIRTYGVEGLRAMIREHVRLGELLGTWISGDQAFELVAPPILGLVVFRYRGSQGAGEPGSQGSKDLDVLNRELQERVNATGKIFITGTRLGGRYVLRVALGHLTTSELDVRAAWELISTAARAR
jgi:aromatic-L-amino-acid decarboxylase